MKYAQARRRIYVSKIKYAYHTRTFRLTVKAIILLTDRRQRPVVIAHNLTVLQYYIVIIQCNNNKLTKQAYTKNKTA